MRTPFLSGRAVLEDEQKFFEIVQTTPDLVEADSLIREALACVKEEKAISQESKNTIRLTQLGALSDRLRAELHRISTIKSSITWQKAVKEVCGEDAYDECISWIRSNGGIV